MIGGVRAAVVAVLEATGAIANAASTLAVFGELLGWWDLL